MVLHCLFCFLTLILYQGHLQNLNISVSRPYIITLQPQYEKGFLSFNLYFSIHCDNFGLCNLS